MEWQPIETAPKDGTIIIIYDGYVGTGYWVEDERGNGSWMVDGGQVRTDHATHWMPLPDPPKE